MNFVLNKYIFCVDSDSMEFDMNIVLMYNGTRGNFRGVNRAIRDN